jgi:hypothetical protein
MRGGRKGVLIHDVKSSGSAKRGAKPEAGEASGALPEEAAHPQQLYYIKVSISTNTKAGFKRELSYRQQVE